MARHLISKRFKKELRNLFSLPRLPRVFEWKPLPRRRFHYTRSFSKAELLPLAAALLLFAVTMLVPVTMLLKTIAYAAAAIVAGYPSFLALFRALPARKLPDEDSLMLLSALFAFLAGHPAAGALIVLFCRAGQLAEAYLLVRAELGLDTLSQLLPEKAHVEKELGTQDVLPEELREGDVFLVREGESIPTDGVILSGNSVLDVSPIGGVSEQEVSPGNMVLSGSINRGETLRIRASAAFSDSILVQQLQLMHEAQQEKTDIEERIEAIATWFAPALLLLSLFAGIVLPLASLHMEGFRWEPYLMTASLLLLIASPSSLILSVPLVFQGGMYAAFCRGLYLRDKVTLETLYHVKAVLFGKTGTITDGSFRVLDVHPVGVTSEELLKVAAAVEGSSRHPLAMAIKHAAGWTPDQSAELVGEEELPGRGVTGYLDSKQVFVGNAAMLEEQGIECQSPDREGTPIHVAVGSRYWGYILLADTVRESVFETIEQLRGAGVHSVRLMTGDVRGISVQLGRALNFDHTVTEKTPEEKLSLIAYLRDTLGRGETVAYVGDGFHDAALFRAADVGIALKPTGEALAETEADVVLMDDSLERVPAAIQLSVQLRRLIMENILFSCGAKLLVPLFYAFGWISLSGAALLTLVFGLVPMLNSLRGFLAKEQVLE